MLSTPPRGDAVTVGYGLVSVGPAGTCTLLLFWTPGRTDGRLPPPGTVLVRRFKGHDYRVTVMPVGFEFDGGHSRSFGAR